MDDVVNDKMVLLHKLKFCELYGKLCHDGSYYFLKGVADLGPASSFSLTT